MAPSRQLRILFVHNALYVPFLLTRAFRRLGHRAASVYYGYNDRNSDLTWGCDYNLSENWKATPLHVGFLLYAAARYDVFHFWARPYMIPALYKGFPVHLAWDLAFLHRLGKKIVFQSDGCYPMIRPSVWKTAVDPEICHICQTTQGDTYGFCSNNNTIKLNAAMERYAHLRFGTGLGYDFEARAEYVFCPVDLELWHDELEIPPQFKYERRKPGSVLIYHGVGNHVIGNRGNIKGTVWVREAVQALQSEGYNIELMYVEGVPNKVVRFYQAQADVVVDQLLLGGGGQSARECLALGKPVLTRIHPEQVQHFERAAAPYGMPPFMPTDKTTIKDNLRRLADDPDLRKSLGARSAQFARQVLDPIKAAERYGTYYEALFD
jgi:glycosyltransferase involved in cell wall biosynthesis